MECDTPAPPRGATLRRTVAEEVVMAVPLPMPLDTASDAVTHVLTVGADGVKVEGLRNGAFSATEEVPWVEEFQCPSIPIMVIVLLIASALAQSFASSALSLFINIDLEFGPVEVTRYWMFVGYTGWVQPAMGWFADVFVVLRERRRPLLILSAAGNTMIYSMLFFTPEATGSFPVFLCASLTSQLLIMGIYIPLNGLVVEVGRTESETQDESIARMSAIMAKATVWRSVGSLVAMVLQTFLAIRLSAMALLGVSAIFFALLMPLALLTPRRLFLRPSMQDNNFYKRMIVAAKAVRKNFNLRDPRSDGVCFVVVLLFVFFYTLMPDASSVYYNYLFGAFRFPMWFYSMNNCIGVLGSILGSYVFSLWMDRRAKQEARGGKRTSMFFIFAVGSIAWSCGYATNMMLCTGFATGKLGIPAEVYVPIDNFIVMIFVRFAFMPTIAMAAEYAPKNFEATAFEVFSVASMGGGTLSALITSLVAEGLRITRIDYSNLWILIVISIACKLIPIPVAYVLPERRREAGLEESGYGNGAVNDAEAETEGHIPHESEGLVERNNMP